MTAVRTTCPYCGVGCGVAAEAGADRSLSVKGDLAHPANGGRLCSKGSALGATVGLEGRLLHPMIGRRRVSWEQAITRTARAFSRAIERHGPDSVAFYCSGQLLTEDYYAANKLMKGFIGSANIDTNSRLCMASAVAAHKQAFGADLVPGCYEDLELADLVVFAGHNAAWTHPVLYRRMERAKARGQRHVVIDPRRTDTAEGADLHLPLRPQTDVRLWNGLLAELIVRGAVDPAFVARSVSGFGEIRQALAADDQSISAVAADCGLDPADLEQFYRLFAETPRTVSLFSMGSNQSVQGTAKGLAILNAHLATGRIGKPGACPFSITGQPNAMGGREVGGLANTLAAHMDFDAASRERIGRFWAAARVAERPGLKAVELFEAVREGRIKALWIMATNPAVSLPDAERVREALARCPFVAVSDCVERTDTLAYAHVKLPALAWSEKDGTVTNSERRISRQRATLPTPGEARADWRIIADVARAMGFKAAFAWRSSFEVFREYARLTAFENEGRTLNLGPLGAISALGYDGLEPVQWPVTEAGGTPRLFTDGRFPTPDGRARMVAVRPTGPAAETSAGFAFALNSGRIRDQWHTMTRTGLAPGLCRHIPEPYVEIHPEDATASGVSDGALTRVITRRGEAVVEARVTERQRRGALFMPMHWTDAFAPQGRVNGLIGPHVDPVSGQPEFKHAPARISAYRETWRGFFLARGPFDPPKGLDLVWRRIPHDACHRHEFAGRGDEAERAATVAALLAKAAGEALSFEDVSGGALRRAHVTTDRLECVLFLATRGRLPPRDWLAGLFAGPLDASARAALLAGRAPGAQADVGPIVCACAGVGAKTILAAASAGATSVDAISTATGAGANCGSCRPDINRLLSSIEPGVRHAA